jgi:hypothetical protein
LEEVKQLLEEVKLLLEAVKLPSEAVKQPLEEVKLPHLGDVSHSMFLLNVQGVYCTGCNLS